MAETFAQLLRHFRTRRGLNKNELAEAVGANRQSVQAWETGHRVPRDRARLEDLAEVLHLTPIETEQLISAARQHPSARRNTSPPPPDDTTAAPPPAQSTVGSPRYQLRAPLPDFVGHAETIRILTDTLGQASVEGRAAAISGVRGMGGIGKTELAYLVANHLIDRFPDAQIVVSLRGTSTSPLTPTQALQQVIYTFTPDAKLPDDPEALQRHYCSVLHQKRALILADDARDAAQVRPLLPPAGCALLVTSRVRFTLSGMTAVDLEVLDEATAVTLLRSLCSRLSSVEAEHLARACGYLPLALRISGSLLHNDPALSIATYLARLADEQQRLAQLHDPDDPGLDVAATLALSYAQLEEPDRRVFRQLGVIVTDFSTELAQAVVAVPESGDVTASLHGLLRRNLVMYDRERDRWQLHDLVRDLTRQQLEQWGESEAAHWRYALATVQIAQATQEQYLVGGDATLVALAQFDAERAHFDAAHQWAQLQAHTSAGDQLLIDITMATPTITKIRYDQWLEIRQWEDMRLGAQRLGNLLRETHALANLGSTYTRLGQPHTAIGYYEQALAITQKLGHRPTENQILGGLAVAYYGLGEISKSITYSEQALAGFREVGDRHNEGNALGNLAVAYADLGELHTAISYYEQHLAVAHKIGDREEEGRALCNLGNLYTELGNTERAIDACNEALTILRTIGDRRSEGHALSHLARAQAIQGDRAQASITFNQALILLQANDHWGAADGQWLFGLALMQHGERERALPLLHTAVAYEQEIGHVKAAEHAALVARLEAGEALPAELHILTNQQAIRDDSEESTDDNV